MWVKVSVYTRSYSISGIFSTTSKLYFLVLISIRKLDWHGCGLLASYVLVTAIFVLIMQSNRL